MKKTYISPMAALLTGIGFMIGSGIFFRASRIVIATQGNVVIATLSWLFIGFTLVFAGLAIASIASNTKHTGGIIGYVEEHYGKKAAFLAGWYQVLVFIPLITGVLVTVLTDYALQLFGLTETIPVGSRFIIWVVVLLAVVGWNILSTRIATLVSASATAIKVIPLILVAVLGIALGDPSQISNEAIDLGIEGTTFVKKSNLALFFAPMLSMAFAFDGWVSVGALTVDMENPNRDFPKVIVGAILITTIIYASYFFGVNAVMPDPAEIAAQGNAHVGTVATTLFGAQGYTLVITCVVISVLGTLNANVMAGGRYVQKLGEDGILFWNEKFAASSKQGTFTNGFLFTLVTTLVALVLYNLQENGVEALQGIGLDDIPMALNAMLFITLFVAVMKMYKKGQVTFFRGVITPIIATVGQVFILIAFFLGNDLSMSIISLGTGGVMILIGYLIHRNKLNS